MIDNNAITDYMVQNLRLLITCSNIEVNKFCKYHDMDILEFIDLIEEKNE